MPQFEAKELPVSQTEHVLSQARKHRFGQRDFARPVTVHLAAEQYVRAVLHQGYKTDLRISARASACPGARESIFVDLLVGDIERAAIQTHQSPTPKPGAPRTPHRDRLDQVIVQLPQSLPTQPCASLRDARLASHPHTGRWIAQPLDSFEQTTQYLAVGGLHVQRQGNDVVDNHLGRQVALTNAGLSRFRQHWPDRRKRKRLGDYAKTDVVRYPGTRRKFSNRTRHLRPPVLPIQNATNPTK